MMKILENFPKIISRTKISHKKEIYLRLEFSDGNIEWRPLSYDGDDGNEDGSLESEYQKLINKK